MYSLNKVVEFINKHNKLNLKDEEVKNITKELIKAGFLEKVAKTEIPIIKTTVESIRGMRKRHNPLKITAETEERHQNCPLCAIIAGPSKLADVMLAGNRPAKYCAEHSVALPIKQEERG